MEFFDAKMEFCRMCRCSLSELEIAEIAFSIDEKYDYDFSDVDELSDNF